MIIMIMLTIIVIDNNGMYIQPLPSGILRLPLIGKRFMVTKSQHIKMIARKIIKRLPTRFNVLKFELSYHCLHPAKLNSFYHNL